MRTGLDHLPASKSRELEIAVEIIQDGFLKALARRTQERFRQGALLKLVLFGSYARGDWVEDPVGRYFSDFDLLAVVNHEDLTDPSEFWGVTEQQLLQALTEGSELRTPVSLLVHSLEEVNDQLRLGRPFFIDIVRDGVILHDTLGTDFTEPRPLAASAALSETCTNFDQWSGSAERALKGALFYKAEGDYKDSTFLLHQAVERLYHCLLLVYSFYSPKTHSLNRLRALCEELDRQLVEVWPRGAKFERRCYELLRSAYVKARYSPHFHINGEELDWLTKRVQMLQTIVGQICRERISLLEQATARDGRAQS